MAGAAFAQDYLKLAAGSVGRLVIALVYFLIAANVLSLGDFGLFATASALGVILARVAGFGFVSPLFRAATVRPRLTGAYLAGLLVAFILSLPLVAALAALAYVALFRGMPWLAFALIVGAEVIGWRILEVVSIVNNGFRNFGRASILVLAGSLIRSVAALLFWLFGFASLTAWAWFYAGACAVSALVAWTLFLPRLRLRLAPRLWLARWSDAMAAAAADIVFYLQAELDKAVVLAAAGPRAAGLYAIAMRMIDLTALPIRVFNQLAMQKVMVDRAVMPGAGRLALAELAIAALSTGALAALVVALWIEPNLLGRNVAVAAALFPLLIGVPALRNLIEYHAELLYGLGRTELRAVLLAVIAVLKAGLIWLAARLLAGGAEASDLGWLVWVNAVFVALYAVSATVTYRTVSASRRRA